jgi:hypothetical protein
MPIYITGNQHPASNNPICRLSSCCTMATTISRETEDRQLVPGIFRWSALFEKFHHTHRQRSDFIAFRLQNNDRSGPTDPMELQRESPLAKSSQSPFVNQIPRVGIDVTGTCRLESPADDPLSINN